MRITSTILLTIGLAATALAESESQDILVVSYPDFVAVDLVSKSHDMQFQVAGPNGYRTTQKYGSDATGFFETQSAEGVVLADGLYKWEAWTTPKDMISREESSAMPDRNNMTLSNNSSGPGRISGSFRVVDGLIVDPDREESIESEQANRGVKQ